MSSVHEIVERFARARVGLKWLGGPIAANADIFQMDIHATPRAGRYVRIWRGARDNLVEVLDHDGAYRQVLLRVREPRRPFTRTLARRPGRGLERVRAEVEAQGGRVLAVWRDAVIVELLTPAAERRYLVGRDDVELFIAQVPGGDTVRAAHEALKPRAVREAETRGPSPVLRQGEWFFVPPRPDELERVLTCARGDPFAVRERAGVGESGERRPHVAEQVLRVRRRRTAFPPRFTYARGVVRHTDHRSLELDGWRRVVRNAEIRPQGLDRVRMRWID